MLLRIVDKTLLEQLQLTDREIAKRKALFELTPEDVALLRACKRPVLERMDWAIEEFYARQVDDPEIALIIGDAETLRRLKGAMRNYIAELFSGNYDHDYVDSRLRVGKIHQRIGVTPKFFLSALHRLFAVLCAIIEEATESPIECTARKDAVLKMLFFDSHFVFDTYVNALATEVEEARKETEAYAESLEDQIAHRTKQLEELSLSDGLTGVGNQRAFQEHLRRELASAQRSGGPIAVMLVDINDFKLLNDTLGHQAGDEILCAIANRLKAAVRANDIVCRIGGDEFCVIMPSAGKDDARAVSERFLEDLAQRDGAPVGVSIGIADTGPAEFCNMEELVRLADQHMYAAKKTAKDGAGLLDAGRIQVAD